MSSRALNLLSIMALGIIGNREMALSAELPGQEMIARVNSEIVRRSTYDKARVFLIEKLKKELMGVELRRELAARERDLLKNLIEDQLLVQRARALDISPDIESIKYLDSIRQKYHLDDMEELAKKMTQEGIDPQEFQYGLKREYLRDKMLRKEVYWQVEKSMSEEEMARHFESHQQDFKNRDGRTRTFRDAKSEIHDRIFKVKADRAIKEYFGKLRKKSVIEVKPGFTDTGVTYIGDANRDLLIATRIGESGTAAALLAKGADSDTRTNNDNDDYTSLMYAAEMGHKATLDILLANGANPNLKTKLGLTALAAAVMERQTDIVKALLARGADANAKDSDGKTALIYAAGEGYRDIVNALLAQQADTGVEDNSGKTALIYAAGEGFRDIVQALLDRDANVNARDCDGKTALMYATIGDHLDILNDLLGKAADGNASDNTGKTALMYAAFGGYPDIIRCLVTGNVDVNARDNLDAETALMVASARGNGETVRALLEAHPDVNLESRSSGLTAIKMAAMNGHAEIVEQLKNAGAKE